MKKFNVTIEEIIKCTVEIEAENEEEAKNNAEDAWTWGEYGIFKSDITFNVEEVE